MNTGIIYLIQPAELVGTNRYKIGMSRNPDLERCKNGYKKGSRYLCIMECNEPIKLENKIKKIFNLKFKLIAGNEYFEGNENEILNIFLEIVNNYKLKINNDMNKNDNNNELNIADNKINNDSDIYLIEAFFINIKKKIIKKTFNLNIKISIQNEREIADIIFQKICDEEKIINNWWIKFIFYINKNLFQYAGKKFQIKNLYKYEILKMSDKDNECTKIVSYVKLLKK